LQGLFSFVYSILYFFLKNGIPPKQPAFIFMLDVSYNSVRSGLVELFCKNIVEILRDLPKFIYFIFKLFLRIF